MGAVVYNRIGDSFTVLLEEFSKAADSSNKK